MKLKNIFRIITMVLSILVIIFNIPLYLNMEQTYEESMVVTSGFGFTLFLLGIALLIVVWIQYFVVLAIIKVYNKYLGFKMWLFIILLTLIETGLILLQTYIVPMLGLFIGVTYGDFII